MKCPYEDIICDCVDTSGMDKGPCQTCRHYPDPVKKLILAYSAVQMLEFLPKTIIKDRKTIFKYHEIHDLNISRDGLDNWVIAYINDKSQKILLMNSNRDIHRCLALMLADLIGNNYIQELKAPIYKENEEEFTHIEGGL